MSSLYRRAEAIVPFVATASLAGKEGFAYKLDASNQAILCTAVTDVPHGIIGAVSDDGLEISAIPFGGNHGTVGLKLAGTVDDLRKMLTLTAASKFEADDASGARVACAIPLETGVADEIIECIIIPPHLINTGVTLGNANSEISANTFTAPAALTSTNGVAAAASADLAALAAETEKVGDDVRALHGTLTTNQAELAALVGDIEELADDVRALYAALQAGLVIG